MNTCKRCLLVSLFLTVLLARPAWGQESSRYAIRVSRVPASGLVLVPVHASLAELGCTGGESSLAVTWNGAPVLSQFIAGQANRPAMLLIKLTPEQRTAANTGSMELATHFDGQATAPASVTDYVLERTNYSLAFRTAKLGGFPLEVTFKKTGFSTTLLRWHDRLHHTVTGSWELPNDKDPVLTVVSDGPIATVIDLTSNFYSASGQRPDTQPVSHYRFYCFKFGCEPVRVWAAYEQSPASDWPELHFMEIHADKNFDAWCNRTEAESHPMARDDQSHRSPGIMGLLAARNLLAVAGDCPAVWDGPQSSYIMPSANFCWRPWTSCAVNTAGWLTFDSLAAEEQASEVLNRLQDEMTAGYGYLHAVLSSQEQSNWQQAARDSYALYGIAKQAESDVLTMQSDDLGVVLTRFSLDSGRGLAVTQLVDRRTATPLLAGGRTPLFRLKYRAENGELKEADSLANWHEITAEPDAEGRGYTLLFTNLQSSHPATQDMQVRIELAAQAGVPGITVRCECNVPDAISIANCAIGCLDVARFGPDMKLFYPTNAGVVHDNPYDQSVTLKAGYPCGWLTMGYMAMWDQCSGVGLYTAACDPNGDVKILNASTRNDAVDLAFDYPVPNLTQGGNGFHPTGHVHWQAFQGDWYDAALIYRDWVRREATWYPELGPNGREDSPLWLRRLSLWSLVSGDIPNMPQRLKNFQEAFGVATAAHWYSWHDSPFDNDYPHFVPTEGFAEAVAEIQKNGNCFVMPYINGRLWDTRDRKMDDWQFSDQAQPYATTNEKGELIIESYGSKEEDGSDVKFAVMCPTTELWRNKVRENVLNLLNVNNTAAVYIDQIAAAEPAQCCHSDHGHPTGGGSWWVQAQGELFARIRQDMRREVEDFPLSANNAAILAQDPNALTQRMLTTECNAEPYMKYFDGYLTWHWQNENMVPAFSAVYSGAIALFGRSYAGNDSAWRMKAAESLAFGEQIGWFVDDMVNEPEKFNFIKKCVRFRDRFVEYFYRGLMARPPQLTDAVPEITEDWCWAGQPTPVTAPAVRTAAWRLDSPNDVNHESVAAEPVAAESVLVLFANSSNEEARSRVQLDLAAWRVTPDTHLLYYLPDSEGEANEVDWSVLDAEQSFPPQSVTGWEFRRR
ncbi:MAG: DUF6259 domain-containing protein [Planctomycetia bacterium]|nr:DUF6259 domain-containing protein [Planctomycetia bacterium]